MPIGVVVWIDAGRRFGLFVSALLDVFARFDNCLIKLRENLVLVEAREIAACLNVFSIAQSIDPGPRATRDKFCSPGTGMVFEAVKLDQFFCAVAVEIGRN